MWIGKAGGEGGGGGGSGPPEDGEGGEGGRGAVGSGVVRRNSRTNVGTNVDETTPWRWLRCWKRGKAEQGISAGEVRFVRATGRTSLGGSRRTKHLAHRTCRVEQTDLDDTRVGKVVGDSRSQRLERVLALHAKTSACGREGS